jgi:hypothetical protein
MELVETLAGTDGQLSGEQALNGARSLLQELRRCAA